MSERRDDNEVGAGEVDVARLIRDSGRRPAPSDDDLAAITAVARAAWEEKTRGHSQSPSASPASKSPVPWFALAASLLIAVLVGWWWLGRPADPAVPVVVAWVERVEGRVLAAERALAPEAELASGTALTTAGGRVALRLSGGQSLRVDAGSSLRLESAGMIELLQGRLYVDSPAGMSGVEVSTALGRVVEIGTQFEVSLDERAESLGVRVREGAVIVEHGDQSTSAALGESLLVRADGSVTRSPVAPADGSWSWVLEIAPAPSVDGMELADFLSWASRELGRPIDFVSPELEVSAGSIELGGGVEWLAPDQALDVFLRGAGLESRLEGERIVVFSSP